jgi:antitoxin (DNA-binding transcriptional repressor) of toxin-antitoxin stability system
MKTVTMLEFRRRAAKILDGLRLGKETIRLTYRGKPVADLVPVKAASSGRPREDDPFYRIHKYAVAGGEDLTNQEIDRILYGET